MAGHATNDPADYFALGLQADKDTEATSFVFTRHLDGTSMEIEHEVESVHEGGDGQEVGLRYQTGFSPDGQVVVNERPEITARLLYWGLGLGSKMLSGGAPTVQGVGTIYTATQTQEYRVVPSATPVYITAEQRFADTIDTVDAVVIDGITIEGEAGRPLKITESLIGGGTPYQRDIASARTPTRETGPPFFFPGGSAQIDGAGVSKLTKFKIDIKRGVDRDIRTNSIFREDAIPLTFDVDLEGTLKYEDRTLYRKVHYNGGSVVPVDLATGSFRFYSNFGAATLARFVEVVVPFVHYTGAKVAKLDPDGKTMYVDFAAMGFRIGAGTQSSFYARFNAASGAADLP